jgi:hypothetical protein
MSLVWLLFALLLGVTISLDDEFVRLSNFLPLFTAWAAYAYGWRAVAPILIVLAFSSVIEAWWNVTDSLVVYYGGWTDAYLIAVAASVAFARPALGLSVSSALPDWRYAAWTLLALLSLLDFFWWPLERHFPFLNLTVLLTASVGIATFRWSVLRSIDRFRLRGLLAIAGVTVFVLAALLPRQLPEDYYEAFGIRTGIASAYGALIALAFVLAVWELLDWRWMLLVLTAVLAVENAWLAWTPEEEPLAVFTPPHVAVLAGAALSPFWRSKGAGTIDSSRAGWFFLASLVLQAVAMGCGNFDTLVWGSIAFLGGLVWQFRGLVAAPLLLVLACFAGALVDPDELAPSLPLRLASIGAIGFVFAFFGLLANRLSTVDERVVRGRGAELAA